jgi:predicted dehydrogenase
MEKPMARSFAECRQMNEAFNRAKQKLFVAYYRRAMPRFVKLKEYLDAGRIGRITGCRYQMSRPYNPTPGQEWRIDADNSGGGLILDVGSHVLDYLDYVLGEFVEFSGTAASSGSVKVEDIVSLQFRTNRNIVGTAHWNFAGSREEDLVEFEGTEGRILCKIFTPGSFTLETRGKTETVEVADPPHVAQPLIQTVVDDLLGKGPCPSTGESAARTSKVIDAALSSFYGGREDEFWKRPQKWRK